MYTVKNEVVLMGFRKLFLKVVLCALAMFLLACRDGGEEVRSDIVARVLSVKGEVTLNGADVSVNQAIRTSDVVETGDASGADLLLRKGSVLRLRDGSRLEFREGELHLAGGALAGVVNKGADKRELRITTPTAIAGVRGTSLFVKVEDATKTYVCTCNGTVHYQGRGHAGGEDVTAAHHAAQYFTETDGQVESEAAAMLYHTDEQMEGLARAVHAEIDWSTPAGQ